jgi:hypothetical protein
VKSFDAVLDRQIGRKFVGSLASPFLFFLPGAGATFSKLLVTLTSDEVDRGVSSQAMQADDASKLRSNNQLSLELLFRDSDGDNFEYIAL